MKLERKFYTRSGLEVARELIGKQLVHRTPEGVTKGIIVEVEAYMGQNDAAAHSFQSRYTNRTAVQFGIGGHAYVYTIYGMHSCMNVVAGGKNIPESVLIRALEPTFGIELMQERRKTQRRSSLCSGPGKLCQAMGITKAHYGMDLCGDELYIENTDSSAPAIEATKRINIDYAGEAKDYPWRFILKDSPFLSIKSRTPAENP